MDIEEIVTQLNCLRDLECYNFRAIARHDIDSKREIQNAIECNTKILNNNITLQVGLSIQFPNKLPFIFIKEKNILTRMIPHVENDGYICFLSSEGILLDFLKPVEIIFESLIMACHVLKTGFQGENHDDLYNEFEAFWRRMGKLKNVISLVHPHSDYGFKNFHVWKLDDNNLLFCDDKEQGKLYTKLMCSVELADKDLYRGYFLSLRSGTYIDLDNLKENFTPKSIRHVIMKNLTGSIRKRFSDLMKRRFFYQGSFEYLLLGVEQPDKNMSLVGIEFSSAFSLQSDRRKSINHPLNKKQNHRFKMIPLNIERHYIDHLILRTGGEINIRNKKVILLGAGAVGSRIVGELIRAGIDKITIVDKDSMSSDNLYRHELGVCYLNANKAQAIAHHFKNKYPLLNIDYKNADIFDILTSYPDMFEKFDLIISAMGNPTIEMFLNRKLRELRKAPPTIFTWVEPLGIGGHALATLNSNKGCFRCLHINPDGKSQEFINRASFAKARQIFTKSVSGCGSQFTPYSSLDALQTAILATRLALNILTGKEKDNPLLSWKGDSGKYLEAGFVLSNRFKFSQEILYETRYTYKIDDCPICFRTNIGVRNE